MKKIIAFFERKKKFYHMRRIEDSAERLNIREFHGRIYISLDGRPIVRAEYLNSNILIALDCIRRDWADREKEEDI